jgi:hydrogenase maturation protein HypF
MVRSSVSSLPPAVAVSVTDRLALPQGLAVAPVLALGAFLKATVTLISDGTALVSGDIGNLDSPQAAAVLEATARQMVADAGVKPCAIAHDLHPDFYSSRLAAVLASEWNCPAVAVQHHAAHMGALMIEHPQAAMDLAAGRCQGLGLALDGFGLGVGNASWGGELIAIDGAGGWSRPAGLALLAQPGGDVAARQPWRMACGELHRLGRFAEAPERFSAVAGGAGAVRLLGQMLDKAINSPLTSSCGRLFDAACGLLGVVPVATFEGEAPMALERMADAPQVMEKGWSIAADGSLCLAPLMAALADLGAGQDCGAIDSGLQRLGANLFHGTLAAALVDWLSQHVADPAVPVVAPLGGGCFFNQVLRQAVSTGLLQAGITPLMANRLSPGDPAISVGQAWMVARQYGNR